MDKSKLYTSYTKSHSANVSNFSILHSMNWPNGFSIESAKVEPIEIEVTGRPALTFSKLEYINEFRRINGHLPRFWMAITPISQESTIKISIVWF